MNGIWSVYGTALGAVAGSFLSTLAIRWGRSEQIARGRSRCDGCGVTIPPHWLIPLVSYVAAVGRCRICTGRIDWRHPVIEGVCAVIGLLAFGLQPGLEGIAGALFGWLLVTLAALDFDHFWLPDALTLPLGILGLGFGLAGVAPEPADHAIGAIAGFLLFALVAWTYRRIRGREGLGQGDAKLLGAIGAWLGWRALPWVVLGASLLGLAWCASRLAGGRSVALADRLPLGTLLAISGWALWLLAALPA